MNPAYPILNAAFLGAASVLFFGCDLSHRSTTVEESTELPSQSETSCKSRPNDIFIFSDDHSYEAVSRLRRETESGRAHSQPRPDCQGRHPFRQLLRDQCPLWSEPGRHPDREAFPPQWFHGERTPVRWESADLSQTSAKRGYQTAVIGKWHLGTDPQGYDFWKVLLGQGTYYAPDFRTPDGLVEGTPGEYVTEAVVTQSIEWLEKGKGSKCRSC